MKRSEINNSIKNSIKVLEESKFFLPSFGYWSMAQWKENKDKIGTLKKIMMGWDVTDFGNGKFESLGAVLFTIRNGDETDASIGTPYAEKIIVLKGGQRLPIHMHKKKSEDIINRGGGVFEIKLFNTGKDGKPDLQGDVEYFCDGIKCLAKAGEVIRITKGNSITLNAYCYHSFWAEKNCDYAVIGEVSSINDDNTDNIFAEEVNRFSKIEEDEEIMYPLCNEYHQVL